MEQKKKVEKDKIKSPNLLPKLQVEKIRNNYINDWVKDRDYTQIKKSEENDILQILEKNSFKV